ncbi:MAG: LON peptidase substrate-binding domain-containing protein [Actinomycetota bacterium]|nr:LON peptidase substrate-binding domain-containing protein [Actinomycetota bacterium]
MADVIPIFPLSQVLLPGMPLPLRIFEERYRQLLIDVTSRPGSASFGVVALLRGSEADQPRAVRIPPELAPVGTLAEILEVEPHEDGSSELLTVGSRRFHLRRLIEGGTAYLRAEIDWLQEPDGDIRPAHVAATRRLCGDFSTLLTALTGRVAVEPVPQDANLLSYYVAGQIPLDLRDRQALLAEPSAAERLRRGIGLLRREVRLLQSTRTIAMAPSVLRLIAVDN